MSDVVYIKLNNIEIPYVVAMEETDNSQGDESMTAAGTTRVDRPSQGVLTDMTITTLPMTAVEAKILRNNLRNGLLGAITVENDLEVDERTFFLQSVKYSWNTKNGYGVSGVYQKDARSLIITLKEKGNDAP